MGVEASAITRVLQHYYPDWEPPAPGSGWVKTICPAHEERNPSAAVNHARGAVNCHACGFSGDVISIIREREGVNYAEARQLAEGFFVGSGDAVPHKPERKPRRRVFSLDP